MIPAPKLSKILSALENHFIKRIKKPLRQKEPKKIEMMIAASSFSNSGYEENIDYDKVNLVGLLFANPEFPFVKNELLPGLPYFHYRSGKNIDFYWAGYGAYWPDKHMNDQKMITEVDGTHWFFSAKYFNIFRQEVEILSRWKFSGDIDLILVNAKIDRKTNKPFLDFSSSIVCNLLLMNKENVIRSVPNLFEDIFRFVETQSGYDPTWNFSDAIGLKTSGLALKKLVLSLLPKDIGKGIENVSHFAVKDLSIG